MTWNSRKFPPAAARRRPFGWLLLLMLLVSLGLRADDPAHKQVLILHSYHLGYIWTSNIHEGLRQVLKESRLPVDVRTEYLDWKHFQTEQNLARQFESLRAKYRNHRFDLVITSDNKATDFAILHREELFPGTPIVFCGYNGAQVKSLQEAANLTGVEEVTDGLWTLRIGQALLPKARQVYVVTDGTETGRSVRREVEASLATEVAGLEVRYLGDGLTTEQLVGSLAALPPDAFVIMGPFNLDSQGRFLDLWELAELVREQNGSVPILHLYEEALGHGILGGSLMSGRLQGEAGGRLAVRVLRGEPISRIPWMTDATVRKVVDGREVRRLGLEVSSVKAFCEVINPPESFYLQHWKLILGSLVASLLAVLGLSVALAIRHQQEQAVRRNEARLKALIQQMPVLICAFDNQGQILVWNRACEEVTGYTAGDLIGKRGAPAWQGEKAWLDLVELACGSEWGVELENSLPAKAGGLRTIRWFSKSHRSPIQGWAGWMAGVDVTSQRTAEAERERLATAVSQASDGVMITSVDGHISYANRAAADCFGTTPEALHGLRAETFLFPSEARQMASRVWTDVWRGKPWRGRVHTLRDATPIVLEILISPVRSPEGAWESATVVFRDITPDLQVEEQLRRSQRMDSLGAMASGMAHDFGNLLTTIGARVDLLELDPGRDQERERDLDVIRKTVQRGGDMIKLLLGFAKSKPSELTRVDLHRVLGELRDLLDRTIPGNIAIQLDLNASEACFQGDASQILQVLLNLAINARDAMPGGGTLAFRTLSDDRQVHLLVKDSGSGMPPEVLNRIFEPFFSTKGEGKGTGMGLAMAYSIVTSHRGQIEVRSEPGQGTTFHLRFPLSEA